MAMGPGERVEVRVGFTGDWASGFEIVEATAGGYRLRRRSDAAVLPVPIRAADLRPDMSAHTYALPRNLR
jgi:hypothetical protein